GFSVQLFWPRSSPNVSLRTWPTTSSVNLEYAMPNSLIRSGILQTSHRQPCQLVVTRESEYMKVPNGAGSGYFVSQHCEYFLEIDDFPCGDVLRSTEACKC